MTKITETKKITWFVADDGKKFDTERNCMLYEEVSRVSKTLKEKYNFPDDVSRVHLLSPMSDKVSALIGLYNTFDNEQGYWYCFKPKTAEDIEFIKTWIDYKSLEKLLYSRETRPVHWDFNLADLKIGEVCIVVVFDEYIKVTHYKEIKESLEDLIKAELEYLAEGIEMVTEVLGK